MHGKSFRTMTRAALIQVGQGWPTAQNVLTHPGSRQVGGGGDVAGDGRGGGDGRAREIDLGRRVAHTPHEVAVRGGHATLAGGEDCPCSHRGTGPQVGVENTQPASMKMSARPSAMHCLKTACVAGITMQRTRSFTRRPASTAAAARMSSMRPFRARADDRLVDGDMGGPRSPGACCWAGAASSHTA